MAEQQSKYNLNQAVLGLNLDSVNNQVNPGQLTFAQNAQVESFDGNMVTYSNEQKNDLCVTFPDGFQAIGVLNIPQLTRILYWLLNPITGDSQIGYSDNNSCTYNVLIDDTNQECKLGFTLEYPIRKAVVKTTNCTTQVYWTDPIRRFIDFENLPWKETVDPDNDFKRIKEVGVLDCNQLNVQANFSIPKIEVNEVVVGGELIMGTYQFTSAYANAFGETYTSYYNVTNPLGIFEQKLGENFNLPTSKAINLTVKDLDTTGLYEWFNLAVVKTINGISSVELIGTFPIALKEFNYTYTGSDKSAIRLDIKDIFEKFPYYDTAQDIFEVDNILGWGILASDDEINYQKIWSQVKLQWETYKIPYNQFEAYNNGVNTEKYRGYFRDEVYAIEGVFLLKNGKQMRAFHIPGRDSKSSDRELINNFDSQEIKQNVCDDPINKERWQVYNTGSIIGNSEEFIEGDNCYLGPYQYGEFAYWESLNTYPRNPLIWGELSGKPIRHHKFPDLLVSPIHNNNPYSVDNLNNADKYKTFEHSIYPIGIKIDINSLKVAIESSNLTQAQKDEIVGFKILRGNRAANKSIIAKGLMHNVGHSIYYDEDNITPLGDYYYPNYPYNDLNRDPYFTKQKLVPTPNSGDNFDYGKALEGFYGDIDGAKSRFTFHSPDTHFKQPSINNQGEYIKLESVLYGKSYGHFVKVIDNAEYKFLTPNTLQAAAAYAVGGGFTIGAGTFGSPTFSANTIPSTYAAMNELFEKLVPYTNFGYSFNSIGFYGNSYPIPNDGYKIRGVEYNKYLNDGIQGIEEGRQINNLRRESSVYIKATTPFKFANEYSTTIPIDNSRYNQASNGDTVIISNEPEFLLVYDLKIDYIPRGVLPINAIYIIGGKEFTVRSSALYFDFNNKTQVNPYSGTVTVQPVDSMNIINTTSGTGLLSPNSPVNLTNNSLMNVLFDFVGKSSNLEPNPAYQKPDIKKHLGDVEDKNISSYYGALKKDIPGQWGDIYNYETIDTGYYQEFIDSKTGNPVLRAKTIFGGDIYINRFAYKSKLQFFKNNTIQKANQTDIAYDEEGNIAWPMFWLSTKPFEFDIDIKTEVQRLSNELFDASILDIVANFVTGSGKGTIKIQNLNRKLFSEIYKKIGIKNINLDRAYVEGIAEQGLMYLFSNGIPYFFCESEVNVDFRQATNEREGNFYPNITTGIPDDWFQEVNVPIIRDNTYFYNDTYSKQNKENSYSHLREDYDPNKRCFTEFPNRYIWSDKSSVEENKNNWLTYRAIARYDLPKSYGKVTSVDNIEHQQLLVRYENKTQLYNALTTVEVSKGPSAFVGNSGLFTGSPALDLYQTDSGYAGSQHQFMLKTEFGKLFIDAKRGQVLLFENTSLQDLGDKGLSKWFSANLPFNILKLDSTIPIDNHFNGIGLTGIYDTLYNRVLITKLDYEAVNSNIVYANGYFTLNGTKVDLNDRTYFINRSWTLSYSFTTNSWVSFHSYRPNFYISNVNYFTTGLKSGTTWNHNLNYTNYTNFYDTQEAYILEYPFVYKTYDEILQGIKDYCSVRIYKDNVSFYEPQDTIYFNKASLYNSQQHTGILELVPKPKNSLSSYMKYPLYKAEAKEILVTKSDNFYNFNTFWDIVKDKSRPIFIKTDSANFEDKELDTTNLDYANKSYKKAQLRAKDVKVRLELDNRNDVKIISHFILTESSQSYK